MPYEIERRFLPADPKWRPEGDAIPISQGYFKLGETHVGSIDFFPWPNFRLNGKRIAWLTPWSYLCLFPHYKKQGALPKGWKARIRRYFHARHVLDLKGPREGTTRFEIDEIELEYRAGENLLAQCGDTLLEKKRYVMPYAGHAWQVDVYEGKHAGLITCEVELKSATAIVKLPPWVGEEITDRKLFG